MARNPRPTGGLPGDSFSQRRRILRLHSGTARLAARQLGGTKALVVASVAGTKAALGESEPLGVCETHRNLRSPREQDLGRRRCLRSLRGPVEIRLVGHMYPNMLMDKPLWKGWLYLAKPRHPTAIGQSVDEAAFLHTMDRSWRVQLLVDAASTQGISNILIKDDEAQFNYDVGGNSEACCFEFQVYCCLE
ncbi:class II Aldolase and Adducin domain-containing protein [Ilyonectria robusta]